MALRDLTTAASKLVRKLAAPFGMMRGIFPVTSGEPPKVGTAEILEGYETMPWLRAVASRVATAVATTEWELVARTVAGKVIRDHHAQRAVMERRETAIAALRAAGELRGYPDHPFFTVLDRPNAFMNRIGLLKITQLHLDLVGDAYWLIERNGLGKPAGFWPVPPHWVTENATEARASFTIRYRNWQAVVPESSVVWFHDPSAANPYTRGTGIGWSLGDELQVDEYAAKMAVQLFYNRARPDFLFMGGDKADPNEIRRLERDWTNRLQGFWRWHKPYFMPGGGDDVKKHIYEFQQPTMEQLVYPNLRKAQRDIVLQTWGFPPELIGISERGTLARTNYEGAEYLFAKWLVWPRAESIRGVLQARVVEREYDERGILHVVSPVSADKEFELNVVKALPYAFDVDRIRRLVGDAPLGDERGRAVYMPLAGYLTADPLDQSQRPKTGTNQRQDDQKGAAPAAREDA